MANVRVEPGSIEPKVRNLPGFSNKSNLFYDIFMKINEI